MRTSRPNDRTSPSQLCPSQLCTIQLCPAGPRGHHDGLGPIEQGEGVVNGFGSGGFNRVMVDVLGDPAVVAPGLIERVGDPSLLCLNIQPVPGSDDAGPVTWQVDRGWTPDPAATEIPLLVTEQACAGGTSAEGRVVVRGIETSSEVVAVDIGVIPWAVRRPVRPTQRRRTS